LLSRPVWGVARSAAAIYIDVIAEVLYHCLIDGLCSIDDYNVSASY
jgi:hypothetical protein